MLRRIHEAGKGVVGMKIIAEGQFRDSDERRDASVRFALNLGCVDTMTAGFERIEEVDDFAARARKAPAQREALTGSAAHPSAMKVCPAWS